MDNPKISVIIPVYNVEPYLRRCLDSVIGQTYANLEILLVDDGSTDGSSVVCDEYREMDSRMLVIHKENGGVSSARNAGLETATGEWISFVDADDCIEPDLYEYLYGLAEKYGADVAQCAMCAEGKDTTEVLFSTQSGSDYYGLSSESLVSFSNSVCNKLYRTNSMEGIRFGCDYPIGEDYLFNAEVIVRTERFVFGAEAKYRYMLWDDSASHAVPTLRALESIRRTSLLAVERVRDNRVVSARFREELMRNSMDICSKIVRFPRPEFEPLRREIRLEVRKSFAEVLMMRGLTVKDRAKLCLIAWCWELYRILLLKSKKS